jgi:folate-binding protein YgfZ
MRVVQIHGDIDKVEKLLQGQITSDINLLTNESYQLSSVCNQKGEVIAGFVIHKSENYKILIDQWLVDVFISELSPFAKFFNVTFTQESGLIFGNVSFEKQDKAFFSNEVYSLSITLEKNDLTETLSKDDWVAANKLALNFDLGKNDIGKFRPLEINYDKTRVSFDKGCFRGQEIIARMKYLGVDRRKFVTIVNTNLIEESKNLKIIGETLKYKNFYIFNSSINRDFFDEFASNHPEAKII